MHLRTVTHVYALANASEMHGLASPSVVPFWVNYERARFSKAKLTLIKRCYMLHVSRQKSWIQMTNKHMKRLTFANNEGMQVRTKKCIFFFFTAQRNKLRSNTDDLKKDTLNPCFCECKCFWLLHSTDVAVAIRMRNRYNRRLSPSAPQFLP